MSIWRIVVLCLYTAAVVCFGGNSARETQLFLQKMPKGLQDRQASAVRQARLGDGRELAAVRNSRNSAGQMPPGMRLEEIPGGHRLYRPLLGSGSPGSPLLIYFHGGGWTFGSVNSCARFCSSVCASFGIPVLGVHYRLAPEEPFPAALEDCRQAVRLAVKQSDKWGISPEKIFLGGDSAGGNLALACALQKDLGVKLRGLILFYPVVEAWNDGSESWRRYGKGFGLDGRLMEEFNLAYLGKQSPRNPLISPACAEDSALMNLPPVLQINAERDILRDQGSRFVVRLKRLGIPVKHHIFPGTVHLFITVPGQETAFRQALMLTGTFIRTRT